MSWLLAFAGFAALIVLHEFGHFIAAKWTGMRVERFFLFFPPKLWSFKRGETEYGIGWLPLGGFVKITGMNPDELGPDADRAEVEEEDRTPTGLLNRVESTGQDLTEPLPPEVLKRAYYNQPVWKRIVVIAAGPAMNLLVAFVILFALAFSLERATSLDVDAIEKGSPAAGQLQEGDKLISVDGVAPTDGGSRPDPDQLGNRADALANQVATHECAVDPPTDGCKAATPARVVVERDGARKTLLITPFYDAANERSRLGFQFGGTDAVPVASSPVEATQFAGDTMWFVTTQTARVLSRIFNAEDRKQINGVVGSYEATRQAIEFDAQRALLVLALISLSLAIINLFPFLPLDGGHIFWSVVEKVRGRRPSFETMERSGAIGFVLIIILAFIGLTNDIGRITSGQGFGGQ